MCQQKVYRLNFFLKIVSFAILDVVLMRLCPGGGRGGLTPWYLPYRYVPPQKVWFLGFLAWKRVKTLWSWSEFSYGFRGNLGVHGRICRFNPKWIRKKEQYANSKWILRNLFVGVLIYWIWQIFVIRGRGGGGLCYTGHKVPSPRIQFLCRLGLKTGIDFTDLFWSGIGYGRYGFWEN